MENTHNFFMPAKNLIGVGAIKDLNLLKRDYDFIISVGGTNHDCAKGIAIVATKSWSL